MLQSMDDESFAWALGEAGTQEKDDTLVVGMMREKLRELCVEYHNHTVITTPSTTPSHKPLHHPVHHHHSSRLTTHAKHHVTFLDMLTHLIKDPANVFRTISPSSCVVAFKHLMKTSRKILEFLIVIDNTFDRWSQGISKIYAQTWCCKLSHCRKTCITITTTDSSSLLPSPSFTQPPSSPIHHL